MNTSRIYLLFCFCLMTAVIPDNIWGQNKNLVISGFVTDEAGDPVIGAAVTVKDIPGSGIATNLDGRYVINAPDNSTLVFSCMGYRTREITATKDNTDLDVVLTAQLNSLREVVVTGYGTQSRRTVSSAISKIGGELLDRTPVNSVGDALKGKIAGVRVYSSDYSSGSEVSIVVRGGSSIEGGSDPLIIIDGMEREDLSSVNPNDIASIEVLKDAASAAIYGSRASNGVVLVTTKSAKFNQAPTITFQTNLAVQDVINTFEFMGAADAVSYSRKRMMNGSSVVLDRLTTDHNAYSSYNSNVSRYSTRYLMPGEAVPQGWASVTDPLDPSKTLIFEDNDWVDIYYPTQFWQTYYVGISGGGKRINYTGSLSYTDDSGSCVGTGSEKLNARMKADVMISDKLKFMCNFNYTNKITDIMDNQYERLSRALIQPATMRQEWIEGEWTGTPMVYENNIMDARYYAEFFSNVSRDDVLSFDGTLTWEILKGLKLTGYIGTWRRNYRVETFEKAHFVTSQRQSTTSMNQVNRDKSRITLQYNKSFGGVHNMSVIAGYENLYEDNYYSYAATIGSLSDDIPTQNAGSEYSSVTSRRTNLVTMGFFGNIQYDYKKKYLVSAVFRADGSSKFVPGNQWGFFPGISVGWVISEEPFMRRLTQLDMLKLRVSYGQTGNNAIGLHDATGLYNFTSRYASQTALIPNVLANGDLRWETSTQINAGIDVSLFLGRLSFMADYFYKTTDNLLQSIKLPSTSGYASVKTNLGTVAYQGFDFELHTVNIRDKDFSWNSDFTWSFVKNKVLKLPSNGNIKNRVDGYTVPMYDESGNLMYYASFGGIAEGEPLGRIYGYKTDKIIATQEEADNAHYDVLAAGWDWNKGHYVGTNYADSKGRKAIGDYEWCDRNGDGTINSYDMYCLGNTIPHSTGGFGNRLSYKKLSLYIYVDWALGHSINNRNFTWYMSDLWQNSSLPVQVWETYNPGYGVDISNAKYALWSPADSNKNYHRDVSSVSVQKGDYLCLREISLSYTLTHRSLEKARIKQIAFTLSANNLCYLTEVIGLSPELGVTNTFSSSFKSHPAVRRFAFGVRMTF